MIVKANRAKKKAVTHIGGHAEAALGFWIPAADDHRMNGAEQADGEEGDRGAQPADQCVDRAKACAAVRVIDALAQHEVGDVDQLSDWRPW